MTEAAGVLASDLGAEEGVKVEAQSDEALVGEAKVEGAFVGDEDPAKEEGAFVGEEEEGALVGEGALLK